ncbi:hypothetical protein [Streptomyces sp. NPDC057496]|uniref:hypothetical protein n=1 Tax=Streptomyces sp. NPDC057496 TaxID=3346149 RepID=UPI0036A8F883
MEIAWQEGDLAGIGAGAGGLHRAPAAVVRGESQPQTLAAGPVHKHRDQLLITRRHGHRRRLAGRHLLDDGAARPAPP